MSEFLRRNVVGLVAIFIALGGTAAALPGKNKVDSGDIKNANVKLGDLAANSVDGTKVVDNSLKGTDVDEASLNIPQQAIPNSLPPSGAAGGDLSGAYPNPEVQEGGLVPGGDLSGTLAAAQVSEAGLVPGGDLAGTLANAQVQEAGLTANGDITGALNITAIANNSLGALEPGVANDEITDGGVDTEDVQNNNLTATDLADNSVATGEVANGTLDAVDLVRQISTVNTTLTGSTFTGGLCTTFPFAVAGVQAGDLVVPVDGVGGQFTTAHLSFGPAVADAPDVANIRVCAVGANVVDPTIRTTLLVLDN